MPVEQFVEMAEISKTIALVDQFRERALSESNLKKATAISILEERMIRSYTSRAEGGHNGGQHSHN